MKNIGLDFGTSNSALGAYDGNEVKLVSFLGNSYTPSTVFYNEDDGSVTFGKDAIDEYITGAEGRIIWSPKNILGTDLMEESTIVFRTRLEYKNIIRDIFQNLLLSYEAEFEITPENLVCGRPVHFNDEDTDLDKKSQDLLANVLKGLGIKNMEFVYEPIAAALSYERQITKESIGLIVDIGGGTSDFTVLRLNPTISRSSTLDRSEDILAIGGIHIAGTNFDQTLSYCQVMPELGLGTSYISIFKKQLPMPNSIYRTLSTWHRINDIYSHDNISLIKDKLLSAKDKEKVGRLLDVVESGYGHALANKVEESKISMSSRNNVVLTTDGLLDDFSLVLERESFEDSLAPMVGSITQSMNQTVLDSGLSNGEINVIFFTGGSSQLPMLVESVTSSFPNATIARGDNFGSVATGLSLLSYEIFR